MTTGERIKKIRQKKGLSQKELGKKLGVSQQMIGQWENAKANPQKDTLEKIANALDVSVVTLIDFDKVMDLREQELRLGMDGLRLGIVTNKIHEFLKDDEFKLLSNYSKLNSNGKKAACEHLSELEKMPQFTYLASNSDIRKYDGSIQVNTKKQRPFDIAIHKFQNNEELTDEEEQAITAYVESDQFKQEKEDIKQIARKAYDYISYKYSYSYASSEEEFNKLQKRHQTESERERNIHKYDASVEITPEAMERLKEDAEAREILKKYESGEKILESEYKKVIEYHNRMMERSKLLQDWLEWYKSTCEPLNNEGRKKVAEYAETLAETDKYAKPKEWFRGRMTKEEIDKAVEAYLNDDTTDEPPEE